MFEKIFKGIPKKEFFATIVLVSLIYLISFMFIKYNQEFSLLGNATDFFNSLIKTFLAAGSITAITAIILLFQSSISSQQEKKKEVFDQKIKLYLEIIKKIDDFFKPKDGEEGTPKIDENEKRELFFMQLQVLLLSNPETSNLYLELYKSLTSDSNENGELSDEIMESSDQLMNFIFSARDDLEVQEELSKDQKKQFERMKQYIKKEAKKVVTSGQRQYFSGYDTWFSQMIIDKKLTKEQQEGFKILHDDIIDFLSKSNNLGNETYTPTGGCTIFISNKRLANIVPQKTYLEIRTLRDHKNNYHRPSVEGLEIDNCRKYNPEVTSTWTNWGHDMYRIKMKYDQIRNFLPVICELMQTGCDTINKDKMLNIGKKDWEHEYAQRLEKIFDSTYSYIKS